MLKKFRVIASRPHRIRGLVKDETFEAEWPDEWLARRIETKHIEMVPDPKPKKPKAEEPKDKEPEDQVDPKKEEA